MTPNLRIIRAAAVFLVTGLAIYITVVGYGLTLQDHRSPEEQSLARLNEYLADLGTTYQATLSSCSRMNASDSETRLGIEYHVNCGVENIEGRARIILSAAFGSRDQIEYSDISEVKK